MDAPVDLLGTAPDGSQEVPADLDRVGWWSPGALPGQAAGSVALVGHTKASGGAVFDHLETLVVGDVIEVDTATATFRYRVASVELVPVDRFGLVADDVYRTTGSHVLTVMTCDHGDAGLRTATVIVRASSE